MAERWQFILNIFDAPEDQLQRLIYADWLEEKGDCKQAARLRERLDESVYVRCHCNQGTHYRRTYCADCERTGWLRRSTRWLLGLELEEVNEAVRVVEVTPRESWQVEPEVYEEDLA